MLNIATHQISRDKAALSIDNQIRGLKVIQSLQTKLEITSQIKVVTLILSLPFPLLIGPLIKAIQEVHPEVQILLILV